VISADIFSSLGAFSFAGFVCWGLWRGELPVRNGPNITRKDNLIIYRIVATILSIIAFVFVLMALALLFGG
jgi:hypothetical protein